jgi:hypothetical protein
VLDVDYAYRVNSYLFGVVKVQKILNRDDAIKAKWITEGGGRDRGHGIEMMGTDGGSDGGTNPTTAENAVDSAVFHLDGIYIRDSDVAVGDCNNRINNGTHINLVITENPIHALAATSLSRTNKHIHDDNYDHGDNDASAEDDDDAALYLEYQNMQSSTSGDTVYDMNAADDIEVAMSFDEWKTRRKQFKQGALYLTDSVLTYLFLQTYTGTRGSFVKAFQVFEGREQLVRGNIDQSASVKNTMYLHSNKVKNVLASTKGVGANGHKPK